MNYRYVDGSEWACDNCRCQLGPDGEPWPEVVRVLSRGGLEIHPCPRCLPELAAMLAGIAGGSGGVR